MYASLTSPPHPLQQVVALKGVTNVKGEANVRGPHIGVTMAGPAYGPMAPPLFTFAGKDAARNFVADTSSASFNQTYNGWPDDTSFSLFLDILIAHMKKHKLMKILLYCDNADVHCSLSIVTKCRANNITLVGFIPQATGYMQPADLCGFGLTKPVMEMLARRARALLSQTNVAHYFEKAMEHLIRGAGDYGGSFMGPGFRSAGLVPWDISVHTDERFAPSDARLGLSASHQKVREAKTFTPEQVDLALSASVEKLMPSMAAQLKAAVEGESKIPVLDLNRVVYTNEAYIKSKLDKLNKKKMVVEAKASKKAERSAKAEDNAFARVVKAVGMSLKRERAAAAKAAKIEAKEARAAAKSTSGKHPRQVVTGAGANPYAGPPKAKRQRVEE